MSNLINMKRGPIMFALIIGMFVAALNETLMGNALPDLMKSFDVSAATVQWLSTAYMLVVGVLVPVTAILQQWFTTRQIFLSAMGLFFVGTVVSAVSPDFGVLLIGRIIQAIGTGMLLPLVMNVIISIYPPEKRGGAMGMLGLVVMFAPAIGPTISGLIVDGLSWRWLFYLVIPFALLSIIMGAVFLKNVSEVTKPRVDLLSIVLSTIGFGGIVYGFSSAGEHGWSEAEVIWTIAAGSVSLLLFVWRQLLLKEPVMDLRAFRYPIFSLVAVLLFVLLMTFFSSAIMLPMFMQGVLMMTAFKSGLILLPGGIVNGLMAPIAGKLFDKFGPRVLVIPGLSVAVVSLWLFTRFDEATSTGFLVAVHIALMIGIALVMMPAQTAGLNQLPRHLHPHGTAILNTLQQVSGAIGTALYIGIMSGGQKQYLSGANDPQAPAEIAKGLAAGINNAFWFGVIIALVALVLGLFLRKGKSPEHEQAAG
ncbi:DHA2 family efflux MFS transporter permease subunit [Brevibacillus ruminantium]|uniref:DHA2 family efflux MFS transporter permease subunit n=1 Tax=Brevibacillus ruminantium TaxID=2950604 RepID=A0ABY4WLQ2_9BACL|nr:MDR family MFS transporter [Brevibacillus ruminantium]USG67794.1 DHA2 family efflux MFS transporter permease subunit [Brevibacillus ruminantium]